MANSGVPLALIGLIVIGLYVFKSDSMMINLDPLILVNNIVTMGKMPDFGPFSSIFGLLLGPPWSIVGYHLHILAFCHRSICAEVRSNDDPPGSTHVSG